MRGSWATLSGWHCSVRPSESTGQAGPKVCECVCVCLFNPISMYHLKTIIASRRHWVDGIVWILYSGGHSGSFLTSITEDVSQYGWICGLVSEHLIGPPAAPSGQIWTAHTLNSNGSLLHSAPRWQRVFLSFCPLFKLLQMTADNRIKVVPVWVYIFPSYCQKPKFTTDCQFWAKRKRTRSVRRSNRS